jgi:hypothetical protein
LDSSISSDTLLLKLSNKWRLIKVPSVHFSVVFAVINHDWWGCVVLELAVQEVSKDGAGGLVEVRDTT